MSKTWPPSPIPKVPPDIVQAATEANLVIFVGAGVSMQMGCPSWSQFADSALKQLAKKGLISYGEVRLLSDLDSRKRLSIALQVADSDPGSIDFAKLIVPPQLGESKVYDHLISIGCTYVTTNYDRFLDVSSVTPTKPGVATIGLKAGASKSELICRPNQLKGSKLRSPGTVVHLHGSVDEPDSMIVTTQHYLRHYNDPQVQGFLKELFARHTVLFTGYGLEEAEILEHILRKGTTPGGHQKRCFMLQGFYAHQEKTYSHLCDYYQKSFNVTLVPFSLDALNYTQLEKIMENWSSELVTGDPLLADELMAVLEAADE